MAASECRHIGGVTAADEVTYFCALHQLCTPTQCKACDDNTVASNAGDCQLRGNEIRTETADLCGMMGQTIPIYACMEHGECTPGRYCRRQTVRSCSTCREFVPVETSTES